MTFSFFPWLFGYSPCETIDTSYPADTKLPLSACDNNNQLSSDEKQQCIQSSQPTSEIDPDENAFLWQDVNPPVSLAHLAPSNKEQIPTSQVETDMAAPKEKSDDLNTSTSSLPYYNDVSGAVVVDWNGLPRFLSPQEEKDRQSSLERAVHEKMMGLPRTSDFAWATPCQGAPLPKYSPASEK
ncbi:hypothetical protein ASPWEDRAFT_176933 [Aspergillus wentii DTO 134E9]|uniref:Uncharacterized protein n=1 Tax=Aspergillus wentii DTO 134E9 TaxID=1073089 RepID=A0A1L9R5R7_ASPWE|nr:uncharacterized protein ASPWEDRAFT_176933 [Aspergillus wentii DTO 134E9]KAI9925240.1 hypothetical protein MW887_006163 [Aspergillus wentii]OJJ30266.1 hypothetical protein ASPWEDRAFT_176933 [Aspergillus wentii DTO 134E9]